jgi:hypothetical protein
MVIQGGLALLLLEGLDVPSRRRVEGMMAAIGDVQAIVQRMTRITRLELTQQSPELPEMLDLDRSSDLGEPGPPDA